MMILGESIVFPIDPIIIAKYLVYLHLTDISYNTAKLHLSVINYVHVVRNMDGPGHLPMLQKLMRGFRNSVEPSVAILPINMTLLSQLVNLSARTFDVYTSVLFNAIAVWLYNGNFRVGELIKSGDLKHTVFVKNIAWATKRARLVGVSVRLESYKHSGGQVRTLLLPTRNDRAVCPVNVLKLYLNHRPSGCPYLFVHENSHVVDSTWLLEKLRMLLNLLKLDSMSYSTHSFRVGYTTDIALQGESYPIIQMRGRWKSDAYLKYIRPQVIPM